MFSDQGLDLKFFSTGLLRIKTHLTCEYYSRQTCRRLPSSASHRFRICWHATCTIFPHVSYDADRVAADVEEHQDRKSGLGADKKLIEKKLLGCADSAHNVLKFTVSTYCS